MGPGCCYFCHYLKLKSSRWLLLPVFQVAFGYSPVVPHLLPHAFAFYLGTFLVLPKHLRGDQTTHMQPRSVDNLTLINGCKETENKCFLLLPNQYSLSPPSTDVWNFRSIAPLLWRLEISSFLLGLSSRCLLITSCKSTCVLQTPVTTMSCVTYFPQVVFALFLTHPYFLSIFSALGFHFPVKS